MHSQAVEGGSWPVNTGSGEVTKGVYLSHTYTAKVCLDLPTKLSNHLLVLKGLIQYFLQIAGVERYDISVFKKR